MGVKLTLIEQEGRALGRDISKEDNKPYIITTAELIEVFAGRQWEEFFAEDGHFMCFISGDPGTQTDEYFKKYIVDEINMCFYRAGKAGS